MDFHWQLSLNPTTDPVILSALTAAWQVVAVKHFRRIEGEERDQTMTLLRLVDPVTVSNNQRLQVTVYKLGGREYRHLVGQNLDILEEVEYDFQQS